MKFFKKLRNKHEESSQDLSTVNANPSFQQPEIIIREDMEVVSRRNEFFHRAKEWKEEHTGHHLSCNTSFCGL